MGNEEYRRLVQEAEVVLLEFLRAFEDVQNNMRVERLGEFQAQVRETTEDGLAAIDDRLSQAGPPEYLQGFTTRWLQASGTAEMQAGHSWAQMRTTTH